MNSIPHIYLNYKGNEEEVREKEVRERREREEKESRRSLRSWFVQLGRIVQSDIPNSSGGENQKPWEELQFQST